MNNIPDVETAGAVGGLPAWLATGLDGRVVDRPVTGPWAGAVTAVRAAHVYRRYRAVLGTAHGPRRGLQVTVDRDGGRPSLVAQWGGISLARDTTPAVLNDNPPRIWSGRSEVVQRLLADGCELCGSREQVEVHHIRALKDQ